MPFASTGVVQESIKEALDRDGYVILRDIFSGEEVAWMRREVTTMLIRRAVPHNGGLSCSPERHESSLAYHLVSDKRLATHWGALFPLLYIFIPIRCTIGMLIWNCLLPHR